MCGWTRLATCGCLEATAIRHHQEMVRLSVLCLLMSMDSSCVIIDSHARMSADLLGDLWKFDGAQWTWMAGASTSSPTAVHGVLGVPAVANTPGGLNMVISWYDASTGYMLLLGNGNGARSCTPMRDCSSNNWLMHGRASRSAVDPQRARVWRGHVRAQRERVRGVSRRHVLERQRGVVGRRVHAVRGGQVLVRRWRVVSQRVLCLHPRHVLNCRWRVVCIHVSELQCGHLFVACWCVELSELHGWHDFDSGGDVFQRMYTLRVALLGLDEWRECCQSGCRVRNCGRRVGE